MAKFYGKVGYGESVELPEGSGVWQDQIIEVEYYGDVITNTRSLRGNEEGVVGDISVSNSISIVADQYANTHFNAIKFVEWAGCLWTVSKVTVQAPRLLLTLGTVYTGPRES